MFRQVHRLLLSLVLLSLAPASTQAQGINCSNGFSSSGACGVGVFEGGQAFQLNGGSNGSSPGLSGSQVLMLPTGATHVAMSLNYQTQVNVQAFSSTFKFVPNGQNVVWMVQNSNNNPIFNEADFNAGAGCEAGFFQGYSQANPPNGVFALELDSWSPLTNSQSFTYSSAQIYTSNPYVECPCIGGSGICGTNNSDSGNITKLSTSPVPLNSPGTSQGTSNGDTYSATVTYDGSNFTLNLYDVTRGGSCPGSSCFTHTWTNVNIPSSVAGNTAWVGVTGATGLAGSYPLYIKSFVYNEGTSTSTPTPKPSGTATPKPSVTPTATPTTTSTPKPTPSPTPGKKHPKKWRPAWFLFKGI